MRNKNKSPKYYRDLAIAKKAIADSKKNTPINQLNMKLDYVVAGLLVLLMLAMTLDNRKITKSHKIILGREAQTRRASNLRVNRANIRYKAICDKLSESDIEDNKYLHTRFCNE